jgi:hypothetical protein
MWHRLQPVERSASTASIPILIYVLTLILSEDSHVRSPSRISSRAIGMGFEMENECGNPRTCLDDLFVALTHSNSSTRQLLNLVPGASLHKSISIIGLPSRAANSCNDISMSQVQNRATHPPLDSYALCFPTLSHHWPSLSITHF